MPLKPIVQHDATTLDAESLSRFLSSPVVFDEPDRLVPPPDWVEHIPFAFWIIDALRPGVFVELGTHSGNSYAAFAQTIQRLALPAASYAIDTWRGDPHAGFYDETVFAEWSAYHDRRFSGFSRLVRSTFAEAVTYFPDRGVDLLHIDGYHTFDAISEDFELWRPKMSGRGVVLLHDINVRERGFGVWRFWELVKDRYPSFAFLHGHGLGVLGLGPDLPAPVAWLLSHASAQPRDSATIRAFFACLGRMVASRYAESLSADVAESAPPTSAEAEVAHLRDLHAQQHEARKLLAEAGPRLAVADRPQIIAELERAFARIGQLKAAHDRAAGDLARTRRRIGDVRHQLRDREEQLRARASHLEQMHREVSRLQDARGGLDEALARNAEEIERLRDQLARVRTGAGAAVAETWDRARLRVASIEASRSWRLTAPLRAASRAARHAWGGGSAGDAHEVVGPDLLFDARYYLECYPEVVSMGLDPMTDYLQTGWREHRNPHPIFDSAFYLERNPDVAASGMNPLVHYLAVGGREGRDPHPLFQSRYYLDRNPDVAASGQNPLAHFVRFGGAEGRSPHPSFDSAFYLARNPDVAAARANPLVHFLTTGAAERRDPNDHFVTAYYVRENPDAAAPGSNALVHYLQIGQRNGRRCSPPPSPPAALT